MPDVKAGQRYGFRVYGRENAEYGSCFNPNKLLIDPYSKKIDGKPSYRTAEEMAWFRPEDERDNAAVAPKSVVIGRSRFNWAKDCRPEIPWGKTIIYEAHVKGFTKQFPDLKYAGTYKALSDKRVLAYLQELGVTTVELLPIHYHLDEYHLQQMGLSNYWGYNTYSHFAVEPSYADNPERAAAEFKQAVKALHQAGLEVILDVVYNHTAEQDDKGPMLCQRGIDNTLWYWHTSYGSYETGQVAAIRSISFGAMLPVGRQTACAIGLKSFMLTASVSTWEPYWDVNPISNRTAAFSKSCIKTRFWLV